MSRKKNLLKTIIVLLLIPVFIFLLLKQYNIEKECPVEVPIITSEETPEILEETPKEKITKIKFSCTGDTMVHNTQFKDAYKNGTYDFSYVFEEIKPYILDADFSIGNLETTFKCDGNYSGYPMFNSPEILASNLKDVGYDVLTTANNHSLDTGYTGIENTINTLDSVGIAHTGTFKSIEDHDQNLYIEKDGVKIAIFAYTYGTNGIAIPKGKEYCINIIDNNSILKNIESAKENNADIIIACMHWGIEYNTTPNQSQIDLANLLFENGVDIIIGNHPHVLEPAEKRTITLDDGSTKDCFVIYSLGNLVSGQTQTNTRTSIILNLEVSKSNMKQGITIDNIDYIPIYTYTNPKFQNYKLIDINKELQKYDSKDSTSVINSSNHSFFVSEIQRLNTMYANIK